MPRFVVTLEYDGTEFAGFQLQGKGERTVQGVLETALKRATGSPARVHGAGRTDAGVHAVGQTAHFDAEWPIPIERMARVLNGALPDDLRVKDARVAEDPRFHVRFSATARVYRYVILNRAAPSALLGRFALHVAMPLDVRAMGEAGAVLVGSHDFAAFGRPARPEAPTVRRVTRIDVRRWKDCVLVTVEGNAFLRQMVRSFVGTLLAVGRQTLTAEGVAEILDTRDRTLCPPVAAARGLCLVRVRYDGTRFESESIDDD